MSMKSICYLTSTHYPITDSIKQSFQIELDTTKKPRLNHTFLASLELYKQASLISFMDVFDTSKLSKEYTYTFDTPGVYLYQCSPHKSMGMIAIVIVGELTQEGVDAIKGAKVKGKSKKKLKALLADL